MILNSENLYLNRAKIVMNCLGVWIPSDEETMIQKAYRVFMMSLQYLFLLFQVVYIIQVWGDLEAVSQASYLFITQASLCYKVTLFVKNKNMQKQLLKQMKSQIFMAQSVLHEKILARHAARIKRFLLAFMVSSQLSSCMFSLKPVFDDVGSRKFPFDLWMPVSPDQTTLFFLGSACQLLTICMSAYMYFGVDSVAFSYVMFACAQIDIIKDRILSIESVWDKKRDKIPRTLSNNHKKLIECIKHHQAVVLFIKLVEDANHTYLLCQLTASVGIICMSALSILVADWKSMAFFSLVTYLSHMVCQLFVACWCGHELTAMCEELHTVLYECIWYEQSQQFQKDLLFAMLRMGRPLVLKAGHYIPLLRYTFVAILRMSYSYFAVLNQSQSK